MDIILTTFQYISKQSIDDEDIDKKDIFYTEDPNILINDYVNRIYIHLLHNSLDVLLVSIHYMADYVKKTNINVNKHNIHKLFLTSASLSHKFWDDDSYSDYSIARIGGIDPNTLHKLEKKYLNYIDWKLYILKYHMTIKNLYKDIKCIVGDDYKKVIDYYYS